RAALRGIAELPDRGDGRVRQLDGVVDGLFARRGVDPVELEVDGFQVLVVDERLEELRRGRAPFLHEDHRLVLALSRREAAARVVRGGHLVLEAQTGDLLGMLLVRALTLELFLHGPFDRDVGLVGHRRPLSDQPSGFSPESGVTAARNAPDFTVATAWPMATHFPGSSSRSSTTCRLRPSNPSARARSQAVPPSRSRSVRSSNRASLRMDPSAS